MNNLSSPDKSNSLAKEFSFFWLTSFILALISLSIFFHKAIFGDEVILASLTHGQGISQSFATLNHYKPRLFYHAIHVTIRALIGEGHRIPWFLISLSLQATALALAGLCLRAMSLSRGPTLLFIAALTTTRFNVYAYSEYTHSLLESLSLTLLFGIAYASIRRIPWSNWQIFTVLFLYSSLVFSHERYLSIAPVICLAAFLSTKQMRLLTRCAISAVPLTLPLIYIIATTIFSKKSFLTGTNGEALSINMAEIATNFLTYTGQLIGLNFGPNWFVGFFNMQSTADWTVGYLGGTLYLIALSLIVLSSKALWQSQKKQHVIFISALLITCALIILVSCITSRMELRWVYPSFILFQFCLVWPLQRSRYPWFAYILLAYVASSNLYYLQGSANIYTVAAGKIAEDVRMTLTDAFNGKPCHLYLRIPAIKNWAISGGNQGLSFSENNLPFSLTLETVSNEQSVSLKQKEAIAYFSTNDQIRLEKNKGCKLSLPNDDPSPRKKK